MVAFDVSDVTLRTAPLESAPAADVIRESTHLNIEACESEHPFLLRNVRSHPLIAAAHGAFCLHQPLVLSPDVLWLTICQGFSLHVNRFSEELRYKLVGHKGKEVLSVRRDDFRRGAANDWPGVVSELCEKHSDYVKGTPPTGRLGLSTSARVHEVAQDIAILDAMHRYFHYGLVTLCGIPRIEVLGTPDDWLAIASEVRRFADFGLGRWADALEPILSQFVDAASGRVDRAFWDDIYKYKGSDGSGGPWVSGWVRDLFPYLIEMDLENGGSKLKANPWLGSRDDSDGPGRADFPSAAPSMHFTWEYFDETIDMLMVSGLAGVAQDSATLALRPSCMWAVASRHVTDSRRDDGDYDGDGDAREPGVFPFEL